METEKIIQQYLTAALAEVNEIELKTPFEIQLAEYLWDQLQKHGG